MSTVKTNAITHLTNTGTANISLSSDGDVSVGDDLTVSGNETVSGNLEVNGNNTVDGNETVGGTLTVTGAITGPSRTITLTGDCTGSVTTTSRGDITINTSVSGKVLFKQTIQSTTLPTSATASAAGKVLVAFGYVTNSTQNQSTTYLGYNSTSFAGYGYGKGYGFGQAIATRTFGGSWDDGGNPSGTINWQYCVEMDEVS